jgi:hypothetical protein
MTKVKLTDKAANVFVSTNFDATFTHVLMDSVNDKLIEEYGDRVRVEFERPGIFSIIVEGSKGMKTLENKVMGMVTEMYSEVYQKTKEQLAFLEGVNIKEVME